MGSLIAVLNLTLSDLERSTSRSLRFFMIRDLSGIHTCLPAVYDHVNLDVTKSVCRQTVFSNVPAVSIIF